MRIDRDLKPAGDLTVGVAPKRLSPTEQKEWLELSSRADWEYEERATSGSDLLGANYQRYMRKYLGAAQWVDTSVSDILSALDKSGRSKDTIVIYASDQGFFLGENGWYDKRWFYEPSAGTPLLIRDPGIWKTEVKSVTSNVDVAPTIVELAGLKPPKEMQGSSLLNLAKGKPLETAPAYGYFYESEDPDHKAPKYVAIVTDRYKVIFYYELNEWEIFDLKTDPHETRNLWPSSVSRTVRAELVRKLLARQRNVKEDVAIIQRVKEAARKNL
jgi:arylsulfatase A-like enzyme